MPLLESGVLAADPWRPAAEDEPIGAGDVIVPLARLDEGLARSDPGRLGVLLPPEAEPSALRAALPGLSLIAVTFPIFRDGRAFTQARTLREHLGFTGEIRATGKPLPDQYEFLRRCGVTTVEVPEGTDPAPWAREHARFDVAYQPSILNETREGFALRRIPG
ncbi:hypothetical protein AA103196_0482 [Ameyamaea chiangmaiensis NBRC 103196]|uniref:DUF934 domain-containing protein n=1 Tax=Ameyamaea chiangmaiensis TaxID=442969 RepID=A0A850PEJ0_9PROT|nr:DUF934 domain-containing protein [Ameyamaea chiangmaiensis]MBS4074879.1 DUF934 domain-containing protein [Ameyamaea chiangmaiensis]NVN40880.1 DUF934 domain-containing protein [Ameyamaea chiangmaiensis]GBQ63082.1 hypothetical protein AA103196_0482 [Ameyamaea chiangmaiensis NBRC 103196]